jgi:hypothetical protein
MPLLAKLLGLTRLAVLAVVLVTLFGRTAVAVFLMPPAGLFLRNGLTLLLASFIRIVVGFDFGTTLP